MVSTKRQIMRDRDRYGGYGEQETAAAVAPRAENVEVSGNIAAVGTPSDIMSLRGYGRSAQPVVSDPLFTDISIKTDNAQPAKPFTAEAASPASDVAPVTAAAPTNAAVQTSAPAQPIYTVRPATELPPRPVKERKPLSREDLMPSIKTQSYGSASREAERKNEEVAAPARKASAHKAISPKTKVLLAVYVAVAVVLAVAVIATGVSISNSNMQAQAIAESIMQKQQTVLAQEAQIAELTDKANVREQAIENGMVEAGDAKVHVNRADRVEYPTATPHTNGFDEFCDWLGEILM